MLRIRLLRRFTTQPNLDPRLDLLKGTAVNPEQVVSKPGKKANTDRLKTRFEDRFQDMKEMFGEDYKTPSEKYDLHFPRVQATGEKDFHIRYHERQGYWRSKVLMWSGFFFFLCGAVFVYLKYTWDQKNQIEVREQDRQEAMFLQKNKHGIPDSVRKARLSRIKKLKEEYKAKYGVEMDDKSLS